MKKFLLVLILTRIIIAEKLEWNGKNGFERLKILNGIVKYDSAIKKKVVKFLPSTINADQFTDLLLDFNDSKLLYDKAGNYEVIKSDYYLNVNMKFNESLTAGFISPKNIIKLKSKKDALLSNSVDLESFKIDFWIYPTLLKNCEIFKKGIYFKFKFYGIVIGLKDKKIFCEFSNFFYDSDENSYNFKLLSRNIINPKEWQNISVIFEKETGKLILMINKKEEDLKVVTKSGNINDEILIPHFLKFDNSEVIIGNGFLGYIDDFRISKNIEDVNLKENKMLIISEVVDLKYYNSIINEINFYFDNIEESDIKIWLRKSNKRFKINDELPLWSEYIKVNDKKVKISNLEKLRYFQWKIEVENKAEDSSFSFISSDIEYTPNYPPLSPKNFRIKSYSDNFIEFIWDKNEEEDLKGYILYWGYNSREYENKVDVGLTNSYIFIPEEYNRNYYFTITAYDSIEPYNESEFSKEIKFFLKR